MKKKAGLTIGLVTGGLMIIGLTIGGIFLFTNGEKDSVDNVRVGKHESEKKKSKGDLFIESYIENGKNALFGLNGVEVDYKEAFSCFNGIKSLVYDDYAIETAYYLGHMYDYGYGVEVDYEQAIEYLTFAADADYGKAQYALGCLYYQGDGVEQDKDKAKEYFEKAIENGCVEAYEGLAMFAYEEGDYETEFTYHQKVIDNGTEPDLVAMSMLNMAEMYEEGDYVEKDEKKAFELIEKAVELNYNQAYYEMAVAYHAGIGVDFDFDKAQELYQLAADRDYLYAIYQIAENYRIGFNGYLDYDKALEYYEKAAKKNHIRATYMVGYMYMNGNIYGISQNAYIAYDYFVKAAEWGDKDAMCYLGKMYFEGIGTAQDDEMGIEWWKKVSDLGYSIGSNQIATYYDKQGKFEEAFPYYDLALSQNPNDTVNMYNVAIYLWNGYGTEKDPERAKSLATQAAEYGHEEAKTLLEQIIAAGY